MKELSPSPQTSQRRTERCLLTRVFWGARWRFIDTVGTFGVASASNHWSCVAAAIGYITSRSATTWHQLVAGDFHLEASGPRYRAALISFFVLCSTAGRGTILGKNGRL